MKTSLIWFEKNRLPDGDVVNGLVAVREVNKNYKLHLQLGMKTAEFNEYVLPAVFVFSEQKWMSAGFDITENVNYWTIPTYPKNK